MIEKKMELLEEENDRLKSSGTDNFKVMECLCSVRRESK